MPERVHREPRARSVASSAPARARSRKPPSASQTDYRFAFEQCPLPMWVFERGTLRLLAVNDAAVGSLGYSREELLFMTRTDLLVLDDSRQDTCESRLQIEWSSEGSSSPNLERFRRRDGAVVEIEIERRPIQFAGRPACLETLKDLTDLMRAEKRFRGLLESAPDAMVITDREGRIVLVNGQMEKLFGWNRAEILGQPLDMLIPAARRDSHTGWRAYVQESHARPMGAGIELYGQRKDGSIFPAEINLSPLHGQDELLITSAVRDITEKRREREKLSQLASIVEGLDDAIISMNLDGSIASWNAGAGKMFGYEEEEAVGRSIMLVAAPGQEEEILRHLGKILAGEPVPRFETIAWHKFCRPIEAWVTMSPIRNPKGEITGASVAARDITARRSAERQVLELNAQLERRVQERTAQLTRSNEELEQFVHVASHDLQEPLRMVSSYTQLVAKRYRGKLDPDADEFIAYVVDGATRMHELINDLLSYSRLDTRGSEMTSVSCEEVVSKVMLNVRVATLEAGATVTHGPLPSVTADFTQLVQLFQNLVGNAIKFCRPGVPPIVRIEARGKDDSWLFSVADNGIGIDPRHKERIFVIFQRLHGRGEYPGTGIGLAICKKIVQRHRGEMWAESEPGKGSTFYFTLPRRRDS